MLKKCTYLMLCMILLLSLNQVQTIGNAQVVQTPILRVGLSSRYEHVEQIQLNHTHIQVGYELDGVFMPEATFYDVAGFILEPAKKTYLMGTHYFDSYEATLTQVNQLRALGINAYAGSASKGIWKLYIGLSESDEEQEQALEVLSEMVDLRFEQVHDQGHRIQLQLKSGYPVLFENSYQVIQMVSLDLRDGIPILDLGVRRYRGRLEVGRYGHESLTAVNIIDMENYLYGVLPGEMPPLWPIEALKAQAVASRSYAYYHVYVSPRFKALPYQLDDTVRSQVYHGHIAEHHQTNRAIDATQDEMLFFEGQVIPAFFFSGSGGHTESSEQVWQAALPYLKGVPDIYETTPYKRPWTMRIALDTFETALEANNVAIGRLTDIAVTGKSDYGRVYAMTFTGDQGSVTVEKETLRYWFGFFSRKFDLIQPGGKQSGKAMATGIDGVRTTVDLSSSYVIRGDGVVGGLNPDEHRFMVLSHNNLHQIPVVNNQSDTYMLLGQGHGHGVGMSQSGARGMADAGYHYKTILQHYYSAVDLN